MSDLVVYGRQGPKCSCTGYSSFVKVLDALRSSGINLDYLEITSGFDIPEGTPARELFSFEGKNCLPITVYKGEVIKSHKYPNIDEIAKHIELSPEIIEKCRVIE